MAKILFWSILSLKNGQVNIWFAPFSLLGIFIEGMREIFLHKFQACDVSIFLILKHLYLPIYLFVYLLILTDRERQSKYCLQIVALDTPNGGPVQKSTITLVCIKLDDVNDTTPVFSQLQYSAGFLVPQLNIVIG